MQCFFANGKNLCLRGGHEHYNLKLSQFQFGYEVIEDNLRDYVVYTENGSKNRSGSYKDKTPNKISLLPAAKETPTIGLPWFKKQRRGRNTLQTMVKHL